MGNEVAQLAQPKKGQPEFLQALVEGSTVVEAAAVSNVPRRTLYEWRKADPAFAAEWEAAYEQGGDTLEAEAVRRAIDGSDTLLIFLLKARRPQRFRDNTRVEVTGANGGPIAVQHERRLTLDDVIDLAERLNGPRASAGAGVPAAREVLAELEPGVGPAGALPPGSQP